MRDLARVPARWSTVVLDGTANSFLDLLPCYTAFRTVFLLVSISSVTGCDPDGSNELDLVTTEATTPTVSQKKSAGVLIVSGSGRDVEYSRPNICLPLYRLEKPVGGGEYKGVSREEPGGSACGAVQSYLGPGSSVPGSVNTRPSIPADRYRLPTTVRFRDREEGANVATQLFEIVAQS